MRIVHLLRWSEEVLHTNGLLLHYNMWISEQAFWALLIYTHVLQLPELSFVTRDPTTMVSRIGSRASIKAGTLAVECNSFIMCLYSVDLFWSCKAIVSHLIKLVFQESQALSCVCKVLTCLVIAKVIAAM